MENLQKIALDLRRKIVKMSYHSGAGHITSACSCLDIIVSLYFGGKDGTGIMRYRADSPLWEGRDYLVLSKGHAGMGQYTALAKSGFIHEDELWTFCSVGTRLGCHPSAKIPGCENVSGALGHGLSFAVGLALAVKLKNTDQTVYCITGDGELQEGSNWEAAMSIAHFNLNNLVWIIDKNDLQILGSPDEIMSLGDLRSKLFAFGFDVTEIDGHNFIEIESSLIYRASKPIVIIANTLKGAGIPYLAGKRDWHNRKPEKDEYSIILSELGMTQEGLKVEKRI